MGFGTMMGLVGKVMEEAAAKRAPEVGVLKGSPSRPRSISTYIMGGGMILALVGLATADILILFPGALLFGVGLLAAVVEAILGK